MQPVGPYTLALNQTVTVPRPGGDGTAWDRVLLTNASPYICAVNINGGQKWLPGYTEALYDAEPGSTVQVTPELVLAGGGIDSTLLATFYAPDDPDDSANYPAQLTSTAVAAAITGVVPVQNAAGTQLNVTPDQALLGTISGATPLGTGSTLATLPILNVAGLPSDRRIVVAIDISLANAQGAVTGTPFSSVLIQSNGNNNGPFLGNIQGVTGVTPADSTTSVNIPGAGQAAVRITAAITAYGAISGPYMITPTVYWPNGLPSNNTLNFKVSVLSVPDDQYFGTPGNPPLKVAPDAYLDQTFATVISSGLATPIPAPPTGFYNRIGPISSFNGSVGNNIGILCCAGTNSTTNPFAFFPNSGTGYPGGLHTATAVTLQQLGSTNNVEMIGSWRVLPII